MNRLPRLHQPSPGIPSADATTVKDQANKRLLYLSVLVVSVFLLLIGRLWVLQVLNAPDFTKKASSQSTKDLIISASRGSILDSHGRPIVDSRFAQTVSVNVHDMGNSKADREANYQRIVPELAATLNMSKDVLEERLQDNNYTDRDNRPIAYDVPTDVAFWLHANASSRFPGVYTQRQSLRDYPFGQLAAHVVGYTGQISAEQLEDEAYSSYKSGDLIGWSGIERSWEHVLRGVDGVRKVRVNARGDVLEDLGETVEAVRGSDIELTLDMDVQKVAEKALADGIVRARQTHDTERGEGRGGTFNASTGGLVVLDPSSGAVIAMASWPTFRPSAFVGGVSTKNWELLQSPNMRQPLLNRVTQAAAPPGSVYKPLTIATALQNGFVDKDTYLPCPAKWTWNESVYRNWNDNDSGSLNMAETLERSCDTVIYEMARRMFNAEANTQGGKDYLAFSKGTPKDGVKVEDVPFPNEFLQTMTDAFGVGHPSDIDLPGERTGVIPGRRWRMGYWLDAKDNYCKQADEAEEGSYSKSLFSDLCHYGFRWRGGDLVNMSIGQGDLQMTPLEVANLYAAIANRGKIFTPHLVGRIIKPDNTSQAVTPTLKFEVPVNPEYLSYIEQGLVRVTEGENGTAKAAFDNVRSTIAGKTGTAENKPKQPYAWFAGYNVNLIYGKRYVVVAMVEEGGSGSKVAAPIVADVFEGLEELEDVKRSN